MGASVMLTSNLWPEVGLCNGAVGKVHQIIGASLSEPHINVKFMQLVGLSFCLSVRS